jgi:hypothetical protein
MVTITHFRSLMGVDLVHPFHHHDHKLLPSPRLIVKLE